MHKVIAIVGMCGAGKSVACDFLENIGYKKVYFGGVTMEKLKEKGMDVTPDNEKIMREGLRKELGMGAFAILLLPKIKELASTDDVVLDGLYSWDELVILQKEFPNMITIAVTTDKLLRYERLAKRTVRPYSFEEAKKRDVAEIENSAKGGPISYADYYILNNGTVEDFHNRLKEILENI
jgi:dephospho-CoA kinase